MNFTGGLLYFRSINFFPIKFYTNPYYFNAAILTELSKREPGRPVTLLLENDFISSKMSLDWSLFLVEREGGGGKKERATRPTSYVLEISDKVAR